MLPAAMKAVSAVPRFAVEVVVDRKAVEHAERPGFITAASDAGHAIAATRTLLIVVGDLKQFTVRSVRWTTGARLRAGIVELHHGALRERNGCAHE